MSDPLKRGSANFINGVPVLLILSLLAKEEMYGYQIVRSIQSASRSQFNFAEGSIYPVLHALEEAKLVKSEARPANGRTRLYYSLTSQGGKKLAEITEEWKSVAKGVRSVLGWEG